MKISYGQCYNYANLDDACNERISKPNNQVNENIDSARFLKVKISIFVICEINYGGSADKDEDNDVGGGKCIVDFDKVDLFLSGDDKREMGELYEEEQ